MLAANNDDDTLRDARADPGGLHIRLIILATPSPHAMMKGCFTFLYNPCILLP